MSSFWHLRWLIPLGFISLIVYQAIFPIKPIVVETNFFQPTPYFGVLLPAGRLERGNDGVKVIAEPLYFDVKLPLRSARLKIELITSVDSFPLRLGVRQSAGWDYAWPQIIYTIKPTEQIYSFTVDEFPYLESNQAQRFLISAPAGADGRITIRRARVVIERRSFNLAMAVYSLTNRLTKLWR